MNLKMKSPNNLLQYQQPMILLSSTMKTNLMPQGTFYDENNYLFLNQLFYVKSIHIFFLQFSEERLEDLTRRLEATEMEAHQLSDALEQMSAQKTAFERDVTQIQNENQRLQVDNESLTAEKWELSAANADLQNRLQAVSYMQVSLSDFTKKKIYVLYL